MPQIRKEGQETESQFDREKCEERMACLGGGIARILVGAATETELRDKKLRYEDALNAVKSAMETGILPGGGAALAHLISRRADVLAACDEDEDVRRGVTIIFDGLAAPVKQIAENCGQDGEVVLAKVIDQPFGFGWNAATDVYENLMDAGVIDPAKVTINAIENSVSVASLVLTTEALIYDTPKDLTAQQQQLMADAQAGMGGMEYM